jgi:hypothetical protein
VAHNPLDEISGGFFVFESSRQAGKPVLVAALIFRQAAKSFFNWPRRAGNTYRCRVKMALPLALNLMPVAHCAASGGVADGTEKL